MKTVVNIGEAKTSLSQLIAKSEAGQEVVIARNGQPVVRLVPVEPVESRELGMFPELNVPSEELMQPLSEDELALWE